MRIREGPFSSPLDLSIMREGARSLCEIYPRGGREAAGRGHDETICATPNYYEAGKCTTIKMERAGGAGRPKAREIFKGVLLVSRLSLSGGPFAVCTRRPCLASLPASHPHESRPRGSLLAKPEFSTPSLILPELSDGMFFPLGY